MKNNIENLKEILKGKNTQEALRYLLQRSGQNIAFASSLGAEDQVLTDILYQIDANANIFTLDTGRLPQETYCLIEQTNTKYNKNITVYRPQTEAVQKLVNQKGMYSFYNSIEDRKECCHVRKIEPLRRALRGLDIWITGLRREQSVARGKMEIVEWDEGNKLIKINPLIEWSEQEVWSYIRKNSVPYNKLHDVGYPSIGCEPCSRAIEKGADIRSGRWWWENPKYKECGLHTREK